MGAVLDNRPAVFKQSPPVTAARRQTQGLLPAGLLTFRLGGDEYGIDILRVQEIRRYESPTRIAGTPAFIKGVVNLRGDIVPVVDLRLTMGCEPAECDELAVVIVLSVRGRVIGAIVDSVSDVIALRADEIRPAPELRSTDDTGHILGIGCVKGCAQQRMLILIDITGLVGSSEAGIVEPAAH